jgi:hypothetical protein
MRGIKRRSNYKFAAEQSVAAEATSIVTHRDRVTFNARYTIPADPYWKYESDTSLDGLFEKLSKRWSKVPQSVTATIEADLIDQFNELAAKILAAQSQSGGAS